MDWKIASAKDSCAACSKAFTAGETYFSSLRAGPGGDVVRADFCTSCFNPAAAGSIFWRTRMPNSRAERKNLADFAMLRDLFFKMAAQGGPVFVPMAYLVGLVLVRKKYLFLKEFFTRGGRDFMRVQRRKGEPAFDVEIPLLDADDIERVKNQLSLLLQADLGEDFDLGKLEQAIQPTALPRPASDEDPTH